MAGKGIQIVVGAEYNGKDLARAQRDIAKLQKQTQSTSDKLKEFGAGMSKVGKNLTTFVTLPLVGIGAAAVAASVQFESSMSKITGLVGIAAEEVEGMTSSVLDMAGETAKSPTELADALFVLTSAGLRGDDALAALESSAKAASAGLGQTNDIARAVAGAMNAYGEDVLGAAQATDVIVATARAGNFETSQFAAAIGRVLPFANQAQASFADMGGAVALLTRTNGDAAQSVTQMAALFRAFVVPTAEATKTLGEVGLSAENVRDSIGEQGLVATLQTLDESLGGNREQLGRLLGSSEAAAAAFQILDADADTIAATFGDVSNAAGITEEAFGVVAETTGFKLQQAMANFKTVLIEVGDILAPFVQKLSDFASDALERFRNLPDGAQQFIVALAGVAAAIGPVLLIGGKLVTMVGSIMAGFTSVGGFAGIAAAVTGPVAIVIAAIVGLIAIFVAMWRESEVFRNAVSDAFNVVKDAITGAVDTIRGALDDNADAINILRDVFKALGDFIGTYIIPLWAGYLSKVIQVVSELIAGWIRYMGFLIEAFQTALPYILNFAAEVIRGVGKMVDFVLGGFETLLGGLATVAGLVGLDGPLRDAQTNVANFRAQVANNMGMVEDAFRGAADSTSRWGEGAVESLDGYQDAAVRARGATDEYQDAAARAARAAGTMAGDVDYLAGVTDAAAAATVALNDAYSNLTAFFSETRAMDRAHQLLADFQEQVATNTAGFDGYSDAAMANRDTFMDWAENQITVAKGLDDPIERLEALKDIQRTARDALNAQGVSPKDSGFFQEIKGIVDEAKAEVDTLGDAVGTAEEAGLDVAQAIATGISQGMGQQEAAINGAGLLAGDALADGVTTSLDIGSPSKVMIQQGRFAAEGLLKGLDNMSLSINAGASLAGRNLIDGLIDGLNYRSGALYARVRAIVSAALSAAQASAGASGSSAGEPGGMARGGLVQGRGGPMADQIPMMLSNGEFVMRAQAVDALGPGFLDALNRGLNPLAGMDAPRATDRATAPSRTMVIENINVTAASNEPAEVTVPRALRRMAWVSGLDG